MKNKIMGEFDGYPFIYVPNPTPEEKYEAAKKGLEGIQTARKNNTYAEFPKYLKYLDEKEKEYSDYIKNNS